jgi:hypothetical protein
MKRIRIGTKNYYQLEQAPSVMADFDRKSACDGCAFSPKDNREVPCPNNRAGYLRCCEDDKDYILIPATKQGLADYVAHRLENS